MIKRPTNFGLVCKKRAYEPAYHSFVVVLLVEEGRIHNPLTADPGRLNLPSLKERCAVPTVALAPTGRTVRGSQFNTSGHGRPEPSYLSPLSGFGNIPYTRFRRALASCISWSRLPVGTFITPKTVSSPKFALGARRILRSRKSPTTNPYCGTFVTQSQGPKGLFFRHGALKRKVHQWRKTT